VSTIPPKISRDHHVTRSLLYVWWQLSRERGEAAFVPTQAFQSPPEVDRAHTAQAHIAHVERLCGQQAFELDHLRSEVDVLKKARHLLPSKSDTPYLNGLGSRWRTFPDEGCAA